MNAITSIDGFRYPEPERSDSSLLPAARPKFTRARRVSDLRVAFKADSFDGCSAVVQQVRATRGSLGCDCLGGYPVAEAIVVIGKTRCRVYLGSDGSLVMPAVIVAPAALQEVRDKVTAAFVDLAQPGSAAR